LELIRIDPSSVHQFWPLVKQLIYIAMKRSDLGSFWYVEQCVLNGSMALWLVRDGQIKAAVVTEIFKNEWGCAGVIVACGGQNMSKWLHLIDGIEDHFRAEGCTKSRIHGRNGWERKLPDYRRKRVVLEKEL
jgi:hypothetical protein